MQDQTRNGVQNPLWSYSARLSEQDNIREAIERLQDRAGVDGNLMFLACWMAATGRGRFPAAALRRAVQISRTWQQDRVRLLRQVRRGMDLEGNDRGFRQAVAALEFQAESREQELLYELVAERDTEQPNRQDAIENVKAYRQAAGLCFTGEDEADVARIVDGAFRLEPVAESAVE